MWDFLLPSIILEWHVVITQANYDGYRQPKEPTMACVASTGLFMGCIISKTQVLAGLPHASLKLLCMRYWPSVGALPISSNLYRTSLVNKEFIIWPEDYTKIAGAKWARSCPLAEPAMSHVLWRCRDLNPRPPAKQTGNSTNWVNQVAARYI